MDRIREMSFKNPRRRKSLQPAPITWKALFYHNGRYLSTAGVREMYLALAAELY